MKILFRNLTVLLGGTCSVLAAIMISPALPGMADAFAEVPNADFLVKLVLTTPALFVAVGALLVGPLLDHWGRKPVLIATLILYSAAGSAGFFLDSLSAILVSRALLGLAVAGIMSGFMALIFDYFEGDALNRFLGLNGACVCLGGIVGLVAAGVLADFGWRYPFLIHLIALIILPGVVFAIQDPRRATNSTTEPVTSNHLPWKRLTPVYVTAFTCTVLFFILPAQLPFYLMDNNNVGASQVGMALALPTVVGLVFALLYQPLRARLSFIAIAGIIFLAYSVNHLILSVSGSYWIVIFGLIFGGIGMGLLSPNNSGWLASLAPERVRGKAVGILTCSIFLGQFLSPILLQPFIQNLGLVESFRLMFGLSLTISILFFAIEVKQTRNEPDLLATNK
ncbi:MFS transporter [Pseudomaricurvus alkylphenolicus]|uniref:MFS transporter n=1 Tax=Pseudomaricurvus alkylphenolicus TaxID=1306991 RepID=UPI0014224AFF|nr:MFS transporter [Pseudomaricurvus alkylphenolicus]NIB42780.1 MFS transporter [Pseudomaricurvus alkylphenolicus]